MIGTTAALERRITGLIREVLHFEVPEPHMDLITAGLIDSMGLVSLVVELEREFGCEIPLEAFDLESFRSVDRMAGFMASALQAVTPTVIGSQEAREA